jgi:filamentous hemagglutinin family protein
MKLQWQLQASQLGIGSCIFFAGLFTNINQIVLAQLTPDQTLNRENSVVKSIDLINKIIEGGAIRGKNIFHSFLEFNVDEGRGVYFHNPIGIENILTRVTGNNPSNILGKLGVLGTANLFLVNPHGIFFGKNASLDIRGSFFATTADGIQIGEDKLFSATEPEKSQLLTIQPNALFTNSLKHTSATINNQGDLTVNHGQNITLFASNIINTGKLSAPQGVIQILANNIKLLNNSRINVSSPRGGGTILIGGDYQGKGNLPTAQTTYIGEKATIYANGNYLENTSEIGNGNGGKVIVWSDKKTEFHGQIMAQGGQQLGNGGFVEVSGKDKLIFRGDVNTDAVNGSPGTLLIDPTNIIIAAGNGDTSNENDNFTIYQSTLEGLSGNTNIVLEATNNIIFNSLEEQQLNLAAGKGDIKFIADADTDGNGNFNMSQDNVIKTNGRNIEIKGVNLNVGSIDANAQTGGGSISLTAFGGNISTKFLSSDSLTSQGTAENGGNISLTAHGGNISTTNVSTISSSRNGKGGRGGDISLVANGGNISTESLSANSISNLEGGRGGDISLVANGGNISTVSIFTHSRANLDGGRGGDISLVANGGNISTENVLSFSSSSNGKGGEGGNIFINSTGGNISTKYILSRSISALAGGNGGDITITANGGSFTTQVMISASESNSGKAGHGGDINIHIFGNHNIVMPFLNSSSYGDDGQGGDVTISGENLTLNSTVIRSESEGNGGLIKFDAPEIKLINTDVSSTSLGSGKSGDILLISSGAVSLKNSRLLTALEPGSTGIGGKINIQAESLNLSDFSLIDTGTYNNGKGGDIEINSKNVSLDNNSSIRSLTTGKGDAGNILLNVKESIFLDQSSSISTASTSKAAGNSGNINISAHTVVMKNGSQLQALTQGTGKSGDISLNVTDTLNIAGMGEDGLLSGIFTSSEGANSGQGGKISIQTSKLNISDGGVLAAQTFSQANGGSILIDANQVSLVNGGQLLTNTFGEGKAGEIAVNAKEEVNITGVDSQFVGRSQPEPLLRQDVNVRNFDPQQPWQITKVEPNDSLETAQVIVDDLFWLNNPEATNSLVEFSSRIPYVSIRGKGDETVDIYTFKVNAGTRAIFDIDNTGIIQTIDELYPAVDTKLTLFDHQGKVLAANDQSPHALGAGGSRVGMTQEQDPYLRYTFTNPGIYYIKVSNPEGGGIPAVDQFRRPTGYDLQISLETPPIQASAVNGGAAAGIFANTAGTGKAGDITINTPLLRISDRAQISASTTGKLNGSGGQITVNADQVTASNGAKLLTNTFGSGKAGNINLNVRDNITLTGNNTGLFANTETGSSGDSGSIIIDPNILKIQDGAGIAVNSLGSGKGGNISVQANRLTLEQQGFINAETAANQGGEINLTIQDLLLLRENSRITATAGTDKAGGDGGNITINAPFIVAVPNENSDVTANAYQGRGGNINITTQGIFGLEYRPQSTLQSDITATSEFGVNGQVTINRLNVDPTQGLFTLPVTLLDPTTRIVETCAASTKLDNRKNEFTITGRGGLPSSPNDLFTGITGLSEVVEVAEIGKNSGTITPDINDKNHQDKSPVVVRQEKNINHQNLEQIQGWIINADGRVVLTGRHLPPTLPNHSCHI